MKNLNDYKTISKGYKTNYKANGVELRPRNLITIKKHIKNQRNKKKNITAILSMLIWNVHDNQKNKIQVVKQCKKTTTTKI